MYFEIQIKNEMKYILLVLVAVTSINAQNGIVKTYYADGTPRSEISYVNDVLDGTALYYYPNGNLYQEKHFSNGILTGAVREFYESGLLKSELNVKNGIREGSQKYYYENGALKEISVFTNGSRKQSNAFDFDPFYKALPEDYLAGNRQQELLNKKQHDLICDVEICPVPIGGLIAIQQNLVYPEHAMIYGLEGKVTLIATINIKGDVEKTEVIIHLGLGCDEAAQEAVKKTKFIPGQKDGKIVDANVTINVEFKINDRALVKYDKSELESALANMNDALSKDFISEKKNYSNEKTTSDYYKNIVRQVPEIRCEDSDVCPYPEEGISSIEKYLEVPFIAKRLKLKGEIEIEAIIDQFGIVKETKVIKAIGYGCDEAVESALMRTKFTPAKKAGVETESIVKIFFPFNYEVK